MLTNAFAYTYKHIIIKVNIFNYSSKLLKNAKHFTSDLRLLDPTVTR